MEKYGYAFLGCVLILLGMSIYADPILHDSKHGVIIDFTGVNHLYGVFMIIVGSLFLWTTFRKRKKNRDNNEDSQ